ncbi:MAG: cyclopropane-fatty-acyl-phospholipid synthase family protein [Pseudomonadota bacterium]
MLKHRIFDYLQKAQTGYLEITTPEHNKIEIGDPASDLKANIVIKDWALIDAVVKYGDIGFGESYMDGWFETDDLIALLSFFVVNQEHLEEIFHGNIFFSFLGFVKNLFNKNTLSGSKKNISFHYDISNEFYQIWLDPSMTYSSAIFDQKADLNLAQKNKYQRILSNLNAGKNILEIGCGWGGFMEEAAKQDQFVKGLTLSTKQADFAQKRLSAQNLKGEIALQDYRHETQKFDNIVSIEMFEAVGKEYWGEYFKKVSSSLNEGGKAIIQTITIKDDIFEKYSTTADFIRKHIFPGGVLPSKSIFTHLAASQGLKVDNEFAFGQSYFLTLKLWLENFNNNLSAIKTLGFNQEFIRKWQFYLAYCAAGFYGQRTDVMQYCLVKSYK